MTSTEAQKEYTERWDTTQAEREHLMELFEKVVAAERTRCEDATRSALEEIRKGS